MHRVLRCFAEGRPGDWEAICLDLDIAVQGESFEEVYSSLNEAVTQYFEAVQELPEDQRSRLLHRSVPLSVRLKYLKTMLGSAFRDRGNNDSHHQFTMPAAA